MPREASFDSKSGQMEGATLVKCSEFGDLIIKNMAVSLSMLELGSGSDHAATVPLSKVSSSFQSLSASTADSCLRP